MSRVEIRLNSAGVRGMLQSPEMLALCEEKAGEIASRADGAWEVSGGVGKYRARAFVRAGDRETYFRNLRTNALLKAMGGR